MPVIRPGTVFASLLLLLAGMLGVGTLAFLAASPLKASSAMVSDPPLWGVDIQVNPQSTVTPALQKNSSFGINPLNPNMVIAGYTSYQADGSSAYSTSTDGGLTWSSGYFTGTWPGTSEPLSPSGDANVGFDAQGTGYYMSFAVGSQTSGYFVLTTTNGTAWSTPIPVVQSDYSQYRTQSTLAVDKRASGAYAGSLYAAWLRTGTGNPYAEGIQLQFSRDKGSTWSREITVSNPGHEFSRGPSVDVARNGTVYVAFEQLENFSALRVPHLYLNRSTDGGQTWGKDQLISNSYVVPVGRIDYEGRELMLAGGDSCNLLRINHYPVIAVSPQDPDTVYAVWNDGRWEPDAQICGLQARHSDIAFSRTTNGGFTWSPVVRLNDDPMGNGIDQFQPSIKVRPDGTVGVLWYDRRFDPNGYFYDMVYSQSTDGGVTWSPNQRVSDVSSDPDAVPDYKGIDDIGSRYGFIYGPNYALPGWFDTRLGPRHGGLFVDRGVFPVLTPTAISTLTSTAVSTRTATPAVTMTGTSSATGTATATFTGTAVATSSRTSTGTVTPNSTASSTPVPTLCPMTFSDVHGSDWFYTYVNCLYCRGAISGYADNTFRPYANTTRGQLCKIVVTGFSIPINTGGAPHFSDVQPTNPFYAYIETAYNSSIIAGYADGTFRWGSYVTRGQLSKIAVIAAAWPLLDPATPTFIDVLPGSAFYQYVETAYAHGVISGYADRTFRVGSNTTRAQISKIVCLSVEGSARPSPTPVTPRH